MPDLSQVVSTWHSSSWEKVFSSVSCFNVCLCVCFGVFASWFDWTIGPQSLMPFPGFDWLFFCFFLVSIPALCCMPPGLTAPALAHSPHLPLSCASSCTSSIRADGHLRPQRSMGGAAQPPDKLLLPDLAPGSGQAWGLSAGTASPLATPPSPHVYGHLQQLTHSTCSQTTTGSLFYVMLCLCNALLCFIQS